MSLDGKKEIKTQSAGGMRSFSQRAKETPLRLKSSVSVADDIQMRAAMISAHFLLPAGARVVDMGCGDGALTYALAVLNPRAGFIGFDSDEKAIESAKKNYELPNLSFSCSDMEHLEIEDNSLDGIVNAGLLHKVYSDNGYNPDQVTNILDKQFQKLKNGGIMMIRDYLMPPENEYVLLELPNVPSRGKRPEELSDADLLVLFSQTARPMAGGSEGFFIEEKTPMREGTRLFRLPHKWALEFIHRKQHRREWQSELKKEYTFFTHQDYNRVFTRLGVRMVFLSPYRNPWVIKNRFKGRFQMYQEDGASMGMPATNYFIVAQKVADRQSLVLEERKPSTKPVSDLKITTVRDKKSGVVHELVRRPGEYCDIMPFRITPDNRLVVYVRGGYPRPIVNAVSRGSHNLDGKKWSGHLIEPITMDTAGLSNDVDGNLKAIFSHMHRYTGLAAKSKDSWYVGDTYFPAPDMIDEAIEPVFIEVENPQKTTWPINGDKDAGFSGTSMITELDGADILLASQVGLLPDPRLELHVFDLMRRYNIPMPRWIGEVMPRIPGQPVQPKDPQDILAGAEETKFEDADVSAVLLKPVKSVFVEKGQTGQAARSGLSARDIEFVVTDDGIENIAVVMPMTRDLNNNLLVGVDPKVMPVPNRLGGDGAMLNAPSFPLPKSVRSIDDAKEYIAAKFKVPVEQVGQLGESYFVHTSVTPQRIYLFTVSSPPESEDFTGWSYALVNSLIAWEERDLGMARFSKKLLKGLARLQMQANDGHAMSLHKDAEHSKEKVFSISKDKIDLSTGQTRYSAVPSRILGQRGALGGSKAPQKTPDQNAQSPTVKGKRLMDSYTQAKEAPVAGSLAEKDKDIDTPALQLKPQPR